SILIEQTIPTVEQRRQRLKATLEEVMATPAGPERTEKIEAFLEENVRMGDLLFYFLRKHDKEIQCAVLEVYIRKIYKMHKIKSMETSACLDSPQDDVVNALHVLILRDAADDADATAKRLTLFLREHLEGLKAAAVRRVTFMVWHKEGKGEKEEIFQAPAIYTFRSKNDFAEDSLFRHIEPSHAFHLDLVRLSSFTIKLADTRQTESSFVHLYEAVPKRSVATLAGLKPPYHKRFFARLVSTTITDHIPSEFERLMVESFNALYLAIGKEEDAAIKSGGRTTPPNNNHIFFNFMAANTVVEPILVADLLRTLMGRYQDKLLRLGVVNVELKLVCRLREDTAPVALRLLASNPTGYVLRVDSYVEVREGARTIYRSIGGGRSGDLGGMDVNVPYSVTRPFEKQRQAALTASDTLYAYDFLELLERAVQLKWEEYAKLRPRSDVLRPRNVISVVELVVARKGTPLGIVEEGAAEQWAAKEEEEGGLELQEVSRPPGLNDVGMVAWKVTLFTPEYVEGRQLVLIANDITIQAGSFGTREDTVFALASRHARAHGLPRIYLAANSGARIGLADSVKAKFKLVVGRTVGIGAYLVRLGHRTIQKSTNSPIILTGFQALNKLMGKAIYTSNDQLGGQMIMFPNGVSHTLVENHLEGIVAMLTWLSYVPSVRRGFLPIQDITGVDVVERAISFTPQKGIAYDPRHLVGGMTNELDGTWVSGFFDKNSFIETLAGWAKTVVVGRARLGGIPCGVIITETRTAEATTPADPADSSSQERNIQQAGGVWFPDSAYKTAQAIRDFNGEDLPLMIFSNWRGFSGGQRDMFDEVLKFGSMIVDALVAFAQPIFVYIPPHAELRGGAWVVVDPTIHSEVMEMYAATEARGGVLEPNGAAEIKFREKDYVATAHRLDRQLQGMDARMRELEGKEGGKERDAEVKALQKEIKERENALKGVYAQVAVQFADLHDTPGRMAAVGVIRQVVPWAQARSFFYWRLRRRLAEFHLRKEVFKAAGGKGGREGGMSLLQASVLLKSWYVSTPGKTAEGWEEDREVLGWMAEHRGIEERIQALARGRVAEEVANLAGESPQGAVEGLVHVMKALPAEHREALMAALKGGV
ncbi:biotin carboxylase, partial [Nannochloropsis oceanica]